MNAWNVSSPIVRIIVVQPTSIRLVIALFAAIVLPSIGRAQLQTATWTGATGNWSSAGLWSTNPLYPNDGNGGFNFNASISGSGTITLDMPITIEQLTFGSGTITGSNNLTLNAGLTWTSGTMSGSGATTLVSGTSTLGVSGSNANLTLARNLTFNGNASFVGTNPTIFFTSGSNATLTVGSGATFTDTTTTTPNFSASSSSNTSGLSIAIASGGMFSKTGVGTTSINIAFNNSGSVSVQAGTLNLAGGGAATGASFAASSGATLTFGGGTYSPDSSTTFTGNGTVAASGGTATITGPFAATLAAAASAGSLSFNGGPYTVAALTISSSGTVGGTANLNDTGGLTWTNGTQSGSGATTVVSGTSTLGISGANANLTLARNLIFNGNVGFVGTNPTIFFTSGSNATLTVASGATLTDVTTTTPNISATSGSNTSGLSFAIANGGAYTKTGVGTTTANIAFNNSGSVSIQNGTLALNGGGSTTGGNFAIALGSSLTIGANTYTIDSASSVTGPGPITVAGGILNFTGVSNSVSALVISSGTLGGAANLSATGGLTWTSGTMSGPGATTTVAGTATFGVAGANANVTLGRNLTLSGNAGFVGTNPTIFFTSGSSATLTISSGATFTDATTTTPNFSASSSSNTSGLSVAIASGGMFSKTGVGTTAVNIPFNNSGSVSVQAGTLNLAGGGAATGASFAVSSGATLTFGGGTYSADTSTTFTGSGTVGASGGTATITGPFAATLAAAASAGSLSFNGGPYTVAGLTVSGSGTVGGTANVNDTGGLTWTSGTQSGSGATTVVSGTSTLGISGANANLTLARNLTFNGNAGFVGTNPTIFFTSGSSATLTVASGATFTDVTTTTPNISATSGSNTSGLSFVIANGGAYTKTGVGTTTANIAFNNSGSVSIQNGILSLNGGGSATGGSFAIASGASLTIGANTYTIDSASTLTGPGPITVAGGILNFTGVSNSVPALVISSGTLGGAANLSDTGGLAWTSGTMSGSGATTSVSGTSTLGISGSNANLTLARNLTFNGNASFVGTNPTIFFTSGSNATLTVGSGATFTDATTTTPNISATSGSATAGLAFTIAGGGVYSKTGVGTTAVQIPFTNNGAVSIQSGTLAFPNGIVTNLSGSNSSATLTGGIWSIANNATLTFTGSTIATNAANVALSGANSTFAAINGLATNNGTFSLQGGRNFTTVGNLTNTGTLDIESGSTLSVTGAYTNNGTVTGGGTITVNNLTFTGGTVSTGVLSASGTLTVTGPTTLASGAVNIGGSVAVNSSFTINAGASLGGSGSTSVPSGSTLTVNGLVSQPVTAGGTVKGSGTLSNTLNIQSGGHLAPGNSPGTVTIGGGLTLNGDYDWDLNGNDNTMAGGTFDKVNGGNIVTLSTTGHVNIQIGSGVDFTNGFWSQPQQWNILAAASGFTDNSIPQVTVNAPSFQGIFPSGMFALSEQSNSLDVNWIPGGARVSTWTGSASGNWSNPSNWAGFPNGDMNTQLVFGASTNPALVDDTPGTFTLNSLTFSAASPAYTLIGNGLNFMTNGAGGLPQIVQNSANGVTIGVAMTLTNSLTVSGTGNVALNGAIGGPGSLTMNGTGILTLGNAANNYSGGTNVLNGVIQVAADSALGTGNVTGASLGTLLFTGSTTTTKSFAMNGGTVSVAAGQTVTFNGSQVSGAYLDGSGTFATNATKGAQFANVTTTPSVTVASNSAADQFIHVNNGGTLNVAANLNFGNTTTFNGFVNQGGGTVTIGASSQVNVSNFQSYGDLTLAVGNPIATQLTNVGTSPLYFNGGSRTFIALPNMPAAFQAGMDLHGQNAIVAGGLFVNNGYLIDSTGTGHTVIADYGALVKGAGFFQYSPITRNSGRVQAGNSPGVASFGQFIFGPGGVSNYVFAIDNATGVPGPTPDANGQVSGWGLINAVRRTVGTRTTSGDFVWTADADNKLLVSLDTLVNPTLSGTDVAGLMANFDPTQSYSWLAAQWSGTYSGPTDAATLDATTGFDTSGFENPIAGAFGWSLSGSSLSLTYTPNAVPEPGTLDMSMIGLAAVGWAARRRRAQAGNASAA